jgi:uncharacterized protein YecE (DUF72 family)
MGKVYAGTSGWAYPTWRPGFYPAKLSPGKFLESYATRLNSVEVNYTFRSLPTKKLLKTWIAATPEGFQFAVKAHQMITHVKRLRGTKKLTDNFFALLRPLEHARKLGPILFQFPPFLKYDLELLKNFLEDLPRDYRIAIEFRHVSWFRNDIYAVMRKASVALCVAESEKLVTPDIRTAKWSYLRLRKESYSASSRAALLRRILRLAKKGDVFAYFMHQERPDGAIYAERLLDSGRNS